MIFEVFSSLNNPASLWFCRPVLSLCPLQVRLSPPLGVLKSWRGDTWGHRSVPGPGLSVCGRVWLDSMILRTFLLSVPSSVAVTRSKDVPPFGPPIPAGVTFRKSDVFRAFLLAKAINAENAAHKSAKFRTMATRTRQEYLRDLAETCGTGTGLDSGAKFNLMSLASKRREKTRARAGAERDSAGAIAWRVAARDFARGADVPCVLGVSNEFVVLVDVLAKEVAFNCFCGDVLGWAADGGDLRVFHGRGDHVALRAPEQDVRDIVARLKVGTGTSWGWGRQGHRGAAGGGDGDMEGWGRDLRALCPQVTTPGVAALELPLRRNGLGQLGFHVRSAGTVAEVEPYGFAWQSGLRPGSRLLDVCKVALVTMTHEQMIDLLRTSVTVTVLLLPPHDDGSPRRWGHGGHGDVGTRALARDRLGTPARDSLGTLGPSKGRTGDTGERGHGDTGTQQGTDWGHQGDLGTQGPCPGEGHSVPQVPPLWCHRWHHLQELVGDSDTGPRGAAGGHGAGDTGPHGAADTGPRGAAGGHGAGVTGPRGFSVTGPRGCGATGPCGAAGGRGADVPGPAGTDAQQRVALGGKTGRESAPPPRQEVRGWGGHGGDVWGTGWDGDEGKDGGGDRDRPKLVTRSQRSQGQSWSPMSLCPQARELPRHPPALLLPPPPLGQLLVTVTGRLCPLQVGDSAGTVGRGTTPAGWGRARPVSPPQVAAGAAGRGQLVRGRQQPRGDHGAAQSGYGDTGGRAAPSPAPRGVFGDGGGLAVPLR